MFFFFFFQAEDGIRDVAVTGVQTCALPISAFSANCAGPRIELRPALPHCPAVGAVNASGLAYEPASTASVGPVTFGRIEPVTPVPGTDVRYTGVTGKPLPVVSWVVSVQPLKSAPRRPVIIAPPPRPWPV